MVKMFEKVQRRRNGKMRWLKIETTMEATGFRDFNSYWCHHNIYDDRKTLGQGATYKCLVLHDPEDPEKRTHLWDVIIIDQPRMTSDRTGQDSMEIVQS